MHYEPGKVTINASGLAEVIPDIVVQHHGLLDSIVTDRGSLFISKIWSSLCYFLGIKQRLLTGLHSQTDGQTERQKSTIEAYLWAFVNFEKNDLAKLLPMAEVVEVWGFLLYMFMMILSLWAVYITSKLEGR